MVQTIDATTFQKPLLQLAETIALKLERESPKILPAPAFVSEDMFVLMKQAMHVCAFLFYINSDERQETDFGWRPAYTFVAAPLVRTVIDCLYNITYILQDPSVNGSDFRKAGFRKELDALTHDENRYKGRPEWDKYISDVRKGIDLSIRASGLNMAEVLAAKKWKTLGGYLSEKGPGGTSTPHQQFLDTFTYGMWRKYSAMSHGGFEGLLNVGLYFTRSSQKFELREKMDEQYPQQMSLHLARAAGILLCIITEVQAYFHFLDANIDERIHRVWSALMPVPEIKELYDEHYTQLMKNRGIKP